MHCTSTSTPAGALGDELVRVVKLLHVARQRMPRQHPLVDPMAYPLLFHLAREPRRVSELADLVHADTSTVSRQVSTLVDHGFVRREPDPDDRRAQVLAVTDDGSTLLAAIREGRQAWLDTLLSDWTDDEVRSFTQQLSRLAGELETSLTTTTRTDP
ncbi:MarR family winged helix-turn-helix transcriptional regulator [Phycicoccus flavus]|uniref:MarR family transcriptional regulator n=1 Tax=Phycicoccus flavus TaxID=2502783 RepID=A0A8T6R1J0_9MICO|nr:MarR family transcriptional regulator [Phycicoccus flavus]NHA67454.1 MarR family transcriptional regulator [Phycicoccus flavus]